MSAQDKQDLANALKRITALEERVAKLEGAAPAPAAVTVTKPPLAGVPPRPAPATPKIAQPNPAPPAPKAP